MDNKLMFPTKRLKKRCVTYLIDGDKVLLGQRKEGIGLGNFVGIGGKVETGETLEQCAKRELMEEINVTALDIKELGSIKFYFPHKPNYDQEVVPFVCYKWKGNPQESEEILPKWFETNMLPFAQMWDDAQLWLPFIFRGIKVKASIIYNKDNKVEHMKIKIYDL